MLLQGSLREFSLPNIFQLVKMSAKSGALTIRRDGDWGRIYFRDGVITYAFAVPQSPPLGERLIRAGVVTSSQLEEALAEQANGQRARIGAILLENGYLERAALEQAVREQIQDVAFDFFGWANGAFEFTADEDAGEEDILVEMDVESVIMEGCRRIDEWDLILSRLGSLECVPRLACGEYFDVRGEVKLSSREWRVVSHIDRHADINTILQDCGLDRLHGAKVMCDLHSRGLVTLSEPVIETLGQGVSVAVRGPIDLYNEVFVNTLTDAEAVRQLRVELIDEKEVEIGVIAGQIAVAGADGDAADILVFTAAAASPEQVWRRLAADSSAWVLLANANDEDSLRATRQDLEFVKGVGGTPLVVATYVSMASDGIAPWQTKAILGLDRNVPVVPCSLRDRESVRAVIEAAVSRL